MADVCQGKLRGQGPWVLILRHRLTEATTMLGNGGILRFVRFSPPLTFKGCYIVLPIPKTLIVFDIFIDQIELTLFTSFEFCAKLNLVFGRSPLILISGRTPPVHIAHPRLHTHTQREYTASCSVPPCRSLPCSLTPESDAGIDPNHRPLGLPLPRGSVGSPDRVLEKEGHGPWVLVLLTISRNSFPPCEVVPGCHIPPSASSNPRPFWF